MTAPLVTVVIPARDEAADIGRCLRAVLAQDHPHDRLEVVVVDGASNDATAEIARTVLGEGRLRRTAVLRNDAATRPSNLNVGLAWAEGEIVCRVDARTVIPPHYVRTCAASLAGRPEVAVVGGAQVAVPRDASARSVGIARALNNRYGMGLSRYRRGATSGPADTVFLGAFRAADLRGVGGWNEQIGINEDFELNRRLSRRGLVWFDATLRVEYLPRGTLRLLWRQYLSFGRAKVVYWSSTDDRPQPRQLLLLALPPAAAAATALGARRIGWPVFAGAAVALGAVEVVGARSPAADVRGHAVAATALAVVAGGWWTGVVSGAVGRAVARTARGAVRPAR